VKIELMFVGIGLLSVVGPPVFVIVEAHFTQGHPTSNEARPNHGSFLVKPVSRS
jgi:hypothetical protein